MMIRKRMQFDGNLKRMIKPERFKSKNIYTQFVQRKNEKRTGSLVELTRVRERIMKIKESKLRPHLISRMSFRRKIIGKNKR